MQKIVIVANGAAYGSESLFNSLRLAIALREQEADLDLRLFLMSDAVTAGLRAAWFSGGAPAGADLVEALVGTALKDEAEDLSRLRSYFSRVVQPRSSGRGGARWRELYAARHRILD